MSLTFRADAYIDGKWRASAQRFDVLNPANQEVIARVPDLGGAETQEAVEAAHRAFPAWAAKSAKERAATLRAWFDLMMGDLDRLARLISLEGGKPIAEAKGEAAYGAAFVEWFGEEAKRAYGRTIPSTTPTRRYVTIRQPIGVSAAITPWNVPLAIFIGMATAALAAGNTVLAKPAEQTPLIAALAVRLCHEAGIPDDVLQLVPGDGKVGALLTARPEIAGVAFTGSTETARAINRALAQRDGPIATLIAETGGQNAMIVDSSALPEQVTRDVVASAFQSAGQRCSALRVLYLQDDVYDGMLEMIRGAFEALVIGDPLQLTTDVG
ncbi:MAG: aldehyde dehydrogenase family protein, partial [Alphaproteobacteria bacterium]